MLWLQSRLRRYRGYRPDAPENDFVPLRQVPAFCTSSYYFADAQADRPGHGRTRSSPVPSGSLGWRLESFEVARAGGGHEGAAATRIGNMSGAATTATSVVNGRANGAEIHAKASP